MTKSTRPHNLSNRASRLGALHDQVRTGKLADARRLGEAMHRENPDDPDVLNLLGVALFQSGERDEGIALLQRATERAPRDLTMLGNLAKALLDHGEFVQAVSAFRRLVAAVPSSGFAHLGLGMAQMRSGDHGAAVAAFETAIGLPDANPSLWLNIAILANSLGAIATAERALRRALEQQPESAPALFQLGTLCMDRGDMAAARDLFERGLRVESGNPLIYLNLGYIAQLEGDLDGAERLYRSAMARGDMKGLEVRIACLLSPVHANETDIAAERTRYADRIAALRKSGLKLRDPLAEVKATPFFLAYHGENDRSLQQALAQFYLEACPELAWTSPHCRPGAERRAGRLRVGFCSAYLRNSHVIGRLFGGFARYLPKDSFETIILRTSNVFEEETAVPGPRADRIVVLPETLAEAREAIAREEIDVLLYPDIGMEPFTYFLAFARLAPVQCVAWGHPVTTGIPNMDYFLSCALWEPDGADEHYSERLIRLEEIPTCYARPKREGPPPRRSALGLPESGRLYLCPQSLFKLYPTFDLILKGILERDPDASIALQAAGPMAWGQRIHERLARCLGDAIGRVHFLPRMPHQQFLSLFTVADAVLDSTVFCGGNTTLEALAMNSPVVTLPGRYLRGRLTQGFYRRLSVPDLIAADAEDFIELAVRFASDASWRADVKARLEARTGDLYDNRVAIDEFARFAQASLVAARKGQKLDRWPQGLDESLEESKVTTR